jgi:hypothetical protein
MLNVYFDGINYLPNALGYLFILFAALLYLKICRGRAIAVIAACAVLIPLSLVPYAQKTVFFFQYGYHLLGRSIAADELYSTLCLWSAAEGAVFAVLCVLILSMTVSVIQCETGYRYDNVNNYSSHLPLHRALTRKATLDMLLGVVMGAAGVADTFLRRVTERIEIGTEGGATTIAVQPEYGWFQWVVFALCVLWIVRTASMGEALVTEVERRYSLD